MNEALLNQLKTSRDQVDYILMTYPSARSNDTALCWYLLRAKLRKEYNINLPFLPQKVLDDLNGKFETWRRMRQKIQNDEKKWLPEPKTVIERYEKAQDMTEVINYV